MLVIANHEQHQITSSSNPLNQKNGASIRSHRFYLGLI
jgi:hypothetical protein